MPTVPGPITRHSTQLSVIEGSIDSHATASNSGTEQEEELEDAPAEALAAPDAEAAIQTTPRSPNQLLSPVQDTQARTSVLTSTSGASRMSGLSDFPTPPLQAPVFALTPAQTLQSYFPPQDVTQQDQPRTASASPTSPPAADVEGDESSVGHHARNPSPAFNAKRSTFGPDSEIAKAWTSRTEMSGTEE